jgi:hypothetical protein
MLNFLKSLFGFTDDHDRPVQVGQQMSEPEAGMLADMLREEGIGAGVRNQGLPPYTSSMSSNYSVWVKPGDAEQAERIMSSEPDETGVS